MARDLKTPLSPSEKAVPMCKKGMAEYDRLMKKGYSARKANKLASKK
jgi:hypothetical protein